MMFSSSDRQAMLRGIGDDKKAIIDDGSDDGLSVYAVFTEEGDEVPLVGSVVVLNEPSLLVTQEEIKSGGRYLVGSGDPGSAVSYDGRDFTISSILPDSAGFALLVLIEV